MFLFLWPPSTCGIHHAPLRAPPNSQRNPTFFLHSRLAFWMVWWVTNLISSYRSISHKWKQICFVGLVFSSHHPRLSFYEPSLAFGYSGLCPVGVQSNRFSHSSGQLCFHQQRAFPSLLNCACCQWCCCVSEIFTFALALPEEEQVLLPSIFLGIVHCPTSYDLPAGIKCRANGDVILT